MLIIFILIDFWLDRKMVLKSGCAQKNKNLFDRFWEMAWRFQATFLLRSKDDGRTMSENYFGVFPQCDRMARLFFYNIWQFTKMKNCPIAKFVAKFDWQCCQILNKPSKNSPRLAKVAKFSQICGQSDKHLTIIIYNSRVVIWANM